ncbi:MAG: cation:proton antiporter [bacterium]|nr:cation:proton antiporter [bacterium]
MASHQILTTFVFSAFFGVLFVVLSSKLRTSAIVVLLAGGYLLGPEMAGLIHPEVLGEGMSAIISLAVGLILFEGGLTLDIKGYRQGAKEIWGLLTRGVLVTWLFTATAIYFVFDFSIPFSLLAGSLIIVTGPTVVGPLLQRVRVPKKVHQILYWEGVLIDPIGVFISLLCYEFIIQQGSGVGSGTEAFYAFLYRFVVGLGVGVFFGLGIDLIMKKGWVPDERLNVFVLTCALLDFAIADTLVPEAGLLSVTISGFILGYRKSPKIDRVIAYKVELKDFLIGLLFMLLAANLESAKFLAYGWPMLGLVAFVMLVVRPANILLSTTGSRLRKREKAFLGWIAPRGIVAASMASIFALHLAELGYEDATFLQAFAYSVIAGTVVVQGFTAKWVAKLLNVWEKEPDGWLIVGAHQLSRTLALYLQTQGRFVILIDSNPREVKISLREGLNAIHDNALTMEMDQHIELNWVGTVFAVTENEELNRLVCQRWGNLLNKPRLFYWATTMLEKTQQPSSYMVGHAAWSHLALKAILAKHLHQRDLIICEDQFDLGQDRAPSHHLLVEAGGQIYLDPPADLDGMAKVLYLKPPKNELLGPTKPEWVVFSEAQSLDELFREMLSLVVMEQRNLDQVSLHKELVEREKEYSSLLGYQISLPHVYCKGVPDCLMIVAKATTPIQTKWSEDPIELVFMVISPENQPEKHLAQISKIARFISIEENRLALKAASDPTELFYALERG